MAPAMPRPVGCRLPVPALRIRHAEAGAARRGPSGLGGARLGCGCNGVSGSTTGTGSLVNPHRSGAGPANQPGSRKSS
jgi:hypothetical protein